MAKVDQKVQMIGSAITLQARRQRADIIEQADRRREAEIEAYRDQLIQGMFDTVQAQSRRIRQDTVRAVAQAEQEARRSLLQHRGALADKVFAAVTDGLLEYARTAPYREGLLADLQNLGQQYDHSASTLYLREEDGALSEQIASLLPGCQVRTAKDIKIGGYRLRNTAARVLIDQTLDQKLREQSEWFYLNSELNII